MRKARFKGAEVMDKSDEGSIFEAWTTTFEEQK